VKVIPSHDPDVYAKLPTAKEKAWRGAWDPTKKKAAPSPAEKRG